MREIEFRGKSKNSGRWVYGDLVTNKYQSRQGIHIYEKSNSVNCKSDYQFVRVDKKTIGQYTGLKDKNGRKIFEGDIVKVDNKYTDIVIYASGCFCMDGQIMNYEFTYQDFDNIEVIGNIYDNLELVNGE